MRVEFRARGALLLVLLITGDALAEQVQAAKESLAAEKGLEAGEIDARLAAGASAA